MFLIKYIYTLGTCCTFKKKNLTKNNMEFFKETTEVKLMPEYKCWATKHKLFAPQLITALQQWQEKPCKTITIYLWNCTAGNKITQSLFNCPNVFLSTARLT